MKSWRIDLVHPRFKLLSGAERAVLGLAEALARAGHRPRIVCHQFHESCRVRLAHGVELAVSGVRLDWTRNRYLNAIADYGRTGRLGALLDGNADALVCFGPALSLAARRAARRPGSPTIYYCWEPPRVLYQDQDAVLRRVGLLRAPLALALAAYRRLDRRLVAAVDAVVTSSPFAAERIRTVYGRAATAITLGVDRTRLDAAGPRPAGTAGSRRSGGAPRLMTVNYLHPRKRVDLIVRALAEIGAAGASPRPELTIVGDGPERADLEALARSLGVDGRTTFAGFVADDDLPRYYWTSDCYVHATRDESFGLSVIEAAWCGLPVVAVDEGGVQQTVEEGVTGFRVQPTPDAIARGVTRVLALPDRGAALGGAGRARIAAVYDWDRGARQLMAVAERVQGDVGRPGSLDRDAAP